MKKRILLFTAIAGFGYLTLMSNAGGPAIGSGGNRTGAKASTANCGGGGCHGTGSSTAVAITVDSGSTMTPTTRYKPGLTYTIKIHGTNSSSLGKFGFEYAAVSGTGASQVQAGTFPTPTAPIFADLAGGITFIEHGSTITASTAGVYDVTFQWTAPTTNVGNITMYCTLNAVNGNASADASDISGNTSVVLTPIITTGVEELSNNVGVNAYPNPVTNMLNVQTAAAGTYNVRVYDLTGHIYINENISTNGNTATLNMGSLAAGLYQVVVEKDGNMQVIPVVKQ